MRALSRWSENGKFPFSAVRARVFFLKQKFSATVVHFPGAQKKQACQKKYPRKQPRKFHAPNFDRACTKSAYPHGCFLLAGGKFLGCHLEQAKTSLSLSLSLTLCFVAADYLGADRAHQGGPGGRSNARYKKLNMKFVEGIWWCRHSFCSPWAAESKYVHHSGIRWLWGWYIGASMLTYGLYISRLSQKTEVKHEIS